MKQVMIECQLVFADPNIPSVVRLVQFDEGDDFFELAAQLRATICEELNVPELNTEQVFYRIFEREVPADVGA